jgi:hypothetical protein
MPDRNTVRCALLVTVALASACDSALTNLTAELPRRLGYSVSADESFVNDCGDRVTAKVSRLKWAPIGEVVVAVIPAGASAPSCYGDGPGLVTLWAADGLASQPWVSHRGPVSLLRGTSNGTAEVALGGGGSAFPVLRWSDATFEPTGRFAGEEEFGAGIILPAE